MSLLTTIQYNTIYVPLFTMKQYIICVIVNYEQYNTCVIVNYETTQPTYQLRNNATHVSLLTTKQIISIQIMLHLSFLVVGPIDFAIIEDNHVIAKYDS